MPSAPPPTPFPQSNQSYGQMPAHGRQDAGYRPARRGRIVAIVLALVVAVVAVVGGFIFWVFSMVRNSSATTSAVASAGRDPRVTALTGTPLTIGLFVSGHVNVAGESGNATLTIPVSGPLGKGNVYAVEQKGFGGWTPTTLEFWPAKNPNDIVRIVEPRSGGAE